MKIFENIIQINHPTYKNKGLEMSFIKCFIACFAALACFHYVDIHVTVKQAPSAQVSNVQVERIRSSSSGIDGGTKSGEFPVESGNCSASGNEESEASYGLPKGLEGVLP